MNMWVLIVVRIMALPGDIVSMQEFKTQKTCEAAAAWISGSEARSLSSIRLTCLPK
jgi:hypothetical protein